MNNGRLFVISGSSGAGKSTLIKALLEKVDKLHFSVSATTRRPRPGEEEGVNYLFVSKAEFEEMIINSELLEYAEYAGNYYGTPVKKVIESMAAGVDVILDIEVQGTEQVKGRMPDAVTIFLMPPNFDELERRLRLRGTDSDEKIVCRLDLAKREFAEAGKYDYIVINDNLENAVNEISSIIALGK